jgi:sugar diacid utilization regulator
VEFDLDGRHTVATPVASGHAIAGWLAVTRARARAADRLVRPAVRATAPVLSALVHIQGAAREQDRAIRGALLEQTLAPTARQDAGTLAARAASLGIDLSVPARIVLVRRHANGRVRADLDEVCRHIERRCDESALHHLVSRRRGAVVALVQGDGDHVHGLVADLVDEEPGIEAGIGRPLSELSSAADSLRDAEIAIHRVAQRREARLLDFADFDLPTLLVSEASAERLAPKVEELLGVLRAHAGLHAALVAYLRHEQDIMRAAEAMHLHHNTLRYRLARVEQLLDRSLKSPATIAALYIALAYDEPIVSTGDASESDH